MRAELLPGQCTVDLSRVDVSRVDRSTLDLSRVDVCPGANMSPPECKCRTPTLPPLQVHGHAKTFAHRSLFEFHQFAQALKMQVT